MAQSACAPQARISLVLTCLRISHLCFKGLASWFRKLYQLRSVCSEPVCKMSLGLCSGKERAGSLHVWSSCWSFTVNYSEAVEMQNMCASRARSMSFQGGTGNIGPPAIGMTASMSTAPWLPGFCCKLILACYCNVLLPFLGWKQIVIRVRVVKRCSHADVMVDFRHFRYFHLSRFCSLALCPAFTSGRSCMAALENTVPVDRRRQVRFREADCRDFLHPRLPWQSVACSCAIVARQLGLAEGSVLGQVLPIVLLGVALAIV